MIAILFLSIAYFSALFGQKSKDQSAGKSNIKSEFTNKKKLNDSPNVTDKYFSNSSSINPTKIEKKAKRGQLSSQLIDFDKMILDDKEIDKIIRESYEEIFNKGIEYGSSRTVLENECQAGSWAGCEMLVNKLGGLYSEAEESQDLYRLNELGAKMFEIWLEQCRQGASHSCSVASEFIEYVSDKSHSEELHAYLQFFCEIDTEYACRDLAEFNSRTLGDVETATEILQQSCHRNPNSCINYARFLNQINDERYLAARNHSCFQTGRCLELIMPSDDEFYSDEFLSKAKGECFKKHSLCFRLIDYYYRTGALEKEAGLKNELCDVGHLGYCLEIAKKNLNQENITDTIKALSTLCAFNIGSKKYTGKIHDFTSHFCYKDMSFVYSGIEEIRDFFSSRAPACTAGGALCPPRFGYSYPVYVDSTPEEIELGTPNPSF